MRWAWTGWAANDHRIWRATPCLFVNDRLIVLYTFFYKHIFYKHIRLRFSKKISTMLSTFWASDFPRLRGNWGHLVQKYYFWWIFMQFLALFLWNTLILMIESKKFSNFWSFPRSGRHGGNSRNRKIKMGNSLSNKENL